MKRRLRGNYGLCDDKSLSTTFLSRIYCLRLTRLASIAIVVDRSSAVVRAAISCADQVVLTIRMNNHLASD